MIPESQTQHMQFMYDDKLMTDVWFNYHTNYIRVVNHSDDWRNLFFGRKKPDEITLADLDYVLEDHCIPRSRANVKEYLHNIGLDIYDPLAIVHITHGFVANCKEWIRFDDDPSYICLQYLDDHFGHE